MTVKPSEKQTSNETEKLKTQQQKQVELKQQIPSQTQQKTQQQTFPKEIEEIEKWTRLKATEIIFNSEKDNWKKGSSVFDSKVKGKEKLVFYVETIDENVIGGVFMKRITSISTKSHDDKCFLFSSQSGKMVKFPIILMRSSDALKICSRYDQNLFIFGNDLTIGKEEFKDKSNVNEKDSIFTYTKRNAMLGRVGTFDIKRVLVIQLK